ncbi:MULTISPECIES: Hpt domain-containing protein [unclassified Thioalkalivibrio]|uniref:hybrid sensor histidine kinase/response regulator n=1 Tax=unclassified Thioalkalivibrio TaxID=2621013 RepID=UPI00035D4850|nr:MULTISPECIES: Hpt domain-containing protein [unclassified Thioalkalivibrio]
MAPSALNWVRDELDKLFVELQDALRRYAENPACEECLDDARAGLEQIRGTLTMVQVDSVVLICDEMLQVMDLQQGAEPPDPEATEALLRAALQLPDYLEQEGDTELPSPMILVPLLNELRAVRGATLLMDVAALMPDLQPVDDDQVGSGGEAPHPQERARRLQEARRGFQRELLELVRGDVIAAARRLQPIAHQIEEAVPPGDIRRLFWIAGGILESLADQGLEASTDIRRLIGRVDRELGRYVGILTEHCESSDDGSEPEYAVPDDLIKTLLFHLAGANSDGEQTRAVREVFGLHALDGDEGGGVGQAVYQNLRAALEDDLAEVRERLDVLMRSEHRGHEDLASLSEQVERIGSTLSLLGLDDGQRHTEALLETLTPERAGEPDEHVDMELAEHLLALESLLDSGLRRRAAGGPRAEFDRHLAAAIYQEALVDVRRVRDTLLGYLSGEGVDNGLREARGALERVDGAMSIGGFETLQALLQPLIRHLDSRVDAGPAAQDLREEEVEALAEVLSSIELALESSGQPWRELDSVHERGVAALQRLGAISGGDAGARPSVIVERAPESADGASQAAPPTAPGDAEALPTEEVAAETSRSSVPTRGVATPERLHYDETVLSTQVRGPDIDPEILDIFLEEAEEEIASLREQFPRWQAAPSDMDALTVIRRSFHTLKGSGRLAGALRLGEFAWVVESFLNRLLEGGEEADIATIQALEDAIAVLPGLVAEVRDDTGPDTPVLDIALRLQALLSGDADLPDEAGDMPASAEDEFAELVRSMDALEVESEVDPEIPAAAVPEASEDDAESLQPLEPPTHAMGGVPEGESEAETDLEPLAESASETDEETLELPESAGTDQQLWEVFAAEARTHLATLHEWIAESGERPDRIPNHDLERALHTLNGSARTADIRGIYAVCGPFERMVRIHREMEWPLAERAQALLAELAGYVATTVADEQPDPAKTDEPPTWSPEVYELLDHATAEQLLRAADADAADQVPETADTQSEAAPMEPADVELEEGQDTEPEEEIDPEFAEVFIEEAHDILEAAFAALGAWRAAGGRPGPDQNAFQREVHTLKGSARMAGFEVVGSIAHSLESALGVETETGLEPREGFFRLAERALTDVQHLVERGVGTWQTDEGASEMLPALRDWASGGGDELEIQPATRGNDEHTAPEPGQADDGELEALTQPQPIEEARRIQDQVRMDAEVLDALVNHAGELATFHRRFEQTVGRVESQVEELERTIARLREQLRKLEIETETQILFRVEKEGGDEAVDFDPLEMDRYSGIQQLSRALAESVSDLEALKQDVGDELQNAGAILLQQRRVGTDLQDQLMRQRMVRFARMAPRLRRVVRQAGDDLGKPVRVEFVGQGAELDRALLERLIAPLEHLLRNAIAHGIEDSDARRAAGKPEAGQIGVSLEQSGSEIRLQVTDDGAGIDADAIRARAVERGLLAADAEITDPQALQLILQSGFSTASEISQVAGRGVGLDVVNSDVKQLGGTLEIDSTPGKGSRFTMRLPFTLAISQALLVQVGEETFAVPMASVEGVVRARAQEIVADDEGHVSYPYAGQDYAVRALGDLMGVETQASVSQLPDHPFPLLLVRADDQRVALRIDGLLGSQEVVVKSVGPVLSRIPGVAGATLQGDGSVMLILDLSMLVRFAAATAGVVEAGPVGDIAGVPRIMVVDDSITIRKVTARLLARHGYDVVTARDGLDAVTMLEEKRPHLILLDVEMPRMDGFEFAAHVRDHPELGQVPIIMITSRSGTKHRERASRLGVNGYLGKPYLENDLLDEIRRHLEEVTV